ncbi:hypothetical protein PGIGA_G00187590 [Pangasianodon gigas]|uniref:Uncharacterized protein n=1 Tax=Pangasianodon gigas TaxID=30993 RepID=A0ACC5WBZ9_PANGG|nr:hypothetical protein [Pangasianodon gigas]
MSVLSSATARTERDEPRNHLTLSFPALCILTALRNYTVVQTTGLRQNPHTTALNTVCGVVFSTLFSRVVCGVTLYSVI